MGLSIRKVASQMDKHPSRVAAIEKGSTDMAFRTFVEYAHSVGYNVEVRLVPTDGTRQPHNSDTAYLIAQWVWPRVPNAILLKSLPLETF